MGAVIGLRRGDAGSTADRPWWLRPGHQPATMAGQLRMLGKENQTPGWRGMWQAAVPAEQQALITSAAESAAQPLLQLRRAQNGPTADVAQQLLRTLRHSADLIDNAWKRTALVALNAGVPLEEVAQWTGMPADALHHMRTGGQTNDDQAGCVSE
jgi:hypothetical protein